MSWRWVLYPPFDSDEWPQASREEIEQAEGRMHELRKHVWKVRADLALPGTSTSLADWSQARRAELEAEAVVARLRGEEYAVRLDVAARPSPSTPCPYIIADERSAAIIYIAMRHVDEEPPLVKRLPGGEVTQATDHGQLYGLLRFPDGADVHFAGPNDEALHKHRLHSRGLGAYDMFEVGNSRWAAVTWNYNIPVGQPAPIDRRRRHFVVTFHDSMVEILAESFACELFEAKWSEIFRHATAASE
jgi:hypothetical protein